MPKLTIDGVEIAEVDHDTAEGLKRLADRGTALLASRPDVTVPRHNLLGARPLAGGALAMRTFEDETTVTLRLLFRHVETRVQNTWPRY